MFRKTFIRHFRTIIVTNNDSDYFCNCNFTNNYYDVKYYKIIGSIIKLIALKLELNFLIDMILLFFYYVFKVQSLYRIYRIGQKRVCKIYRFVAAGTMEEKIYNRQVSKLDLADRIVDHQRIVQNFNENELKNLYVDNSDTQPGDFREEIEQNVWFARQLNMNIVHRFKHSDRLLNNDLDFVLSEEEKQHAYADYRRDIENF